MRAVVQAQHVLLQSGLYSDTKLGSSSKDSIWVGLIENNIGNTVYSL